MPYYHTDRGNNREQKKIYIYILYNRINEWSNQTLTEEGKKN
jgi:hypothetical protein